MNLLPEIVDRLGHLPTESLVLIVALGALGLAAFAIHAVASVMKTVKGK